MICQTPTFRTVGAINDISVNGKICPCVSRAVGANTVNTLYRNDAR
jgi:hypothetical protein